MRISDVLSALRAEFPSVSHSKLRFLEEQGLIEPVRTASGYRQYSAADVERLRYVLVEQRDRYLPLKVIKDQLSAMDESVSMGGPMPMPAQPRAVQRHTVESLARAAAVEQCVVEELVDAGVVRRTASGHFDEWAVDVVTIAVGLSEYGIQARHLRSLRTASDRHVTVVEQVVAPWRSQQTASAHAHAVEVATDVGELFARLHTTWVRQGVSDLTT